MTHQDYGDLETGCCVTGYRLLCYELRVLRVTNYEFAGLRICGLCFDRLNMTNKIVPSLPSPILILSHYTNITFALIALVLRVIVFRVMGLRVMLLRVTGLRVMLLWVMLFIISSNHFGVSTIEH